MPELIHDFSSTRAKLEKFIAETEAGLVRQELTDFRRDQNTKIESLEKLVMSLAKELQETKKSFQLEFKPRGIPRGRPAGRRLTRELWAVEKRWASWKKELETKSPIEIARQWGYTTASVTYAMKRGFVTRTRETESARESLVPRSLIGHTLVSLPPTRKGPRRR
jgi:hypothetical protein